jgi:hypothetical protein
MIVSVTLSYVPRDLVCSTFGERFMRRLDRLYPHFNGLNQLKGAKRHNLRYREPAEKDNFGGIAWIKEGKLALNAHCIPAPKRLD